MIDGQKLRTFREEAHVKAIEIADVLGVSRQYVSELEHSPGVSVPAALGYLRACERIFARREKVIESKIEIVEQPPTIFVDGKEWA